MDVERVPSVASAGENYREESQHQQLLVGRCQAGRILHRIGNATGVWQASLAGLTELEKNSSFHPASADHQPTGRFASRAQFDRRPDHQQ